MSHSTKVVSFCVNLLGAAVLSTSVQASSLEPDPIYKKTVLEVVDTLQEGHYNRVDINDELSSKLLDRYLQDLDPNRVYFYKSDIEEFKQKWQNQLDDQLKSGDLTAAYAIFNRFAERQQQRTDYVLSRLQDDNVNFDFTRNESFDPDRKDAEWIDSEAAMDNIWRKRVKDALLDLKLAGKDINEARETLLKRFKTQQQRSTQIKSDDVFQTYLNSLTALYDPHTNYFSPQVSENFQINMSLSLEGIGAVLQSDNEMTKIVSVVPGGPAQRGGQLKAGDKIVGVGQGKDGAIEDIIGWRLDEVVQKIRGPKDSYVRLQVIPSNAASPSMRKIIVIRRDKVKLEEQAAKSQVIDVKRDGQVKHIGVIRVPAFYLDFEALRNGDPDYRSTTRDVKKLINKLKAQNIDGLVIDLRENGGGSLREANEMVGLFIKRGPTVQIRDPDGRIDVLGDFDASVTWNGPLTVLVNRLSASASEIFTGAIKDYHRGVIVGSQTFGKGTVQTLQPIDYGQLKLTHAKFYRISGESTQDRGVSPDIAFPPQYDDDNIGESALDNALPWDTVRPVRHAMYAPIPKLLPTLQKEHEQRIRNNPDFRFMRQQIEHQNAQKEKKLISLNEKVRKQERDKAEAWLLNAENARRAAKKEAPLKSISEMDDELPKDENGRPISPESQAQLHESVEITQDLADLLNSKHS